jgi:hypothetical protein
LNEDTNFRCRFYKKNCKSRLVVNPSLPQVRLYGNHNHPPEAKAVENVYKNIVTIQKFVRSSDGRVSLETVKIKQENP